MVVMFELSNWAMSVASAPYWSSSWCRCSSRWSLGPASRPAAWRVRVRMRKTLCGLGARLRAAARNLPVVVEERTFWSVGPVEPRNEKNRLPVWAPRSALAVALRRRGCAGHERAAGGGGRRVLTLDLTRYVAALWNTRLPAMVSFADRIVDRSERAAVVDRGRGYIPLPESVAPSYRTPPGDRSSHPHAMSRRDCRGARIRADAESVSVPARVWSARRCRRASAERRVVAVGVEAAAAGLQRHRAVRAEPARYCQVPPPKTTSLVAAESLSAATASVPALIVGPRIAVGAERGRAGTDLGQSPMPQSVPPSVALLPLVSKLPPPRLTSPRGSR